MNLKRGRGTATILLLCASVCVVCSCDHTHRIVVGSKNFTEQLILGEMAAQQIERKLHVPVKRELDLGGTLLAQEAIVKGDIDIYPEYTGTAATEVLKTHPGHDPIDVYMRVKDAYRERFHLIWLPPLGFNDTFAMVVRRQDADRLPEHTLSAAVTRAWRLGVGYEFLTRPDGLPALDRTYGLHWQGTPKTMDLGLLYRALAAHQVDMVAGNSTDSFLTDEGVTVLADDKKVFPPYNACFVAREDLMTENPPVRLALTMLANHVTEERMRSLNRQVDVEHRPVAEVVRAFLATQP